jgi:hypothetical protein
MSSDRLTLTEIIDGRVPSIDRVYGFERVRNLCRATPCAVRRARTRLTAHPHPAAEGPAVAEATLMLDGDLIVCAGATAATMREAIDLLILRLQYRLMRRFGEPERDQPMGSLPVTAA